MGPAVPTTRIAVLDKAASWGASVRSDARNAGLLHLTKRMPTALAAESSAGDAEYEDRKKAVGIMALTPGVVYHAVDWRPVTTRFGETFVLVMSDGEEVWANKALSGWIREIEQKITNWDQREMKFKVGEIETFVPAGDTREVKYRPVERVWASEGDIPELGDVGDGLFDDRDYPAEDSGFPF